MARWRAFGSTYGTEAVAFGDFEGPGDKEAAWAVAHQKWGHLLTEPLDGSRPYIYLDEIRHAECERCGQVTDVTEQPSYTAYERPRLPSWERLLLDDEGLGSAPDPNRCPWLCAVCADEHKSYWEEMWSYARSQ